MDNLSAFQLLPNHVVKLIVDHVAHSSRLRFDGVTTDSDEYKVLQMPLLWVCHNFRAFVRERFCRVYRLTLDNDRDRAEALLCSWPTLFKELGCSTHPLAKELWVKLDIKAVFSGKALQLLSDAPYEGCSFPLVRKLCICLTSDNEEGYYDQEPDHGNDREPEQDNDPEPVLENDREPENAVDWALEGGNNWAFEEDYDDWELESDSSDWEVESDNGGWEVESDNGGWEAENGNDWELEDHSDFEAECHNDGVPKTRYVYPPDTAANIAALVQWIKQMVPAVSEIYVYPLHGDAVGMLLHCNFHTLDLVQQLFDIVERRTVIAGRDDSMLVYSDLEPIRDLVHLECSLDSDFYSTWPLIHRSTKTLQFLDLDVGDMELTNLVINRAGRSYLEYPCLHTLMLHSHRDTWPTRMAVIKDIVPFPRLLRLSLLLDYPFGDDILFRGNAATLEYLELSLLPKTVSKLKKYKVFTPTSHPNLQCVKLDTGRGYIPNIFATVAEYLKFVVSIAPGASVRQIVDLDKYPGDCNLALLILKNHGCIQILSLPYMPLSIWQAITLVESLPLLSDLTTNAPVLGELPQSLSIAELPEYVRSNYAPMGKRFRCWNVCGGPERDYEEIATCVLLLALACPNFDYAALYRDYRKPFMKVMQDKIAEPEFSQDAPRLRRLLFNGWKNC
ncbi:hypothetical protein IW146_001607 [Coemansia sp. RSA 922]|nr:hypothetical protein GGH13_001042 [Coemansia sp. S155-1]KAJ2116344.1 hypothetical protein IW146_001607 [Coemansia sp. RSA 922]KAJ2354412.1 hypothetical protein GGH92_000041 [Coemansia sp. RSA 2673]